MGGQLGESAGFRIHFSVLAVASFCLIWLWGHNAIAAEEKRYPSQPIKIVVPMAPGGGADLFARILQDYLAKELGVPVLVENRAGASGMVGATVVLKAKPDGYTDLRWVFFKLYVFE